VRIQAGAVGPVLNEQLGRHRAARDYRPWRDRQRPDPFAAALRGAKAAVDSAGILNPGVLIRSEPEAKAPEAGVSLGGSHLGGSHVAGAGDASVSRPSR
jgi:hypothetical protein